MIPVNLYTKFFDHDAFFEFQARFKTTEESNHWRWFSHVIGNDEDTLLKMKELKDCVKAYIRTLSQRFYP